MMSINRRVARIVRDARERMREAAAAEHVAAANEQERAAHELAAERDQLNAYLDGAKTALASARTVHDLSWVAEHAQSHHQAVANAAKTHTTASALVDEAAVKLRERVRQLKSSERVIDLVDRDRAERDARTEQRANDDMTASRR